MEALINNSRKIVVKIGSNTIAKPDGTTNFEVLGNIVEQLNVLMDEGKQVVVVTSGAMVAGVTALNKWKRKNDLNYKQALSAIGQVELMNTYKELFGQYDKKVAQLLFTREDFEGTNRNLHIRNTLFTLVDEGIIPIINENDTVSVEEIQIGDNDTLAAITSVLWNADLLIILSDIEGVYTKNPKKNPDAVLIEAVENINDLETSIEMEGKTDFGTGGICTKLEAAKRVTGYDIPMILTNGKSKDAIINIRNGKKQATLFKCSEEVL